LRIGVIKLESLEICGVSASHRPIKKVEQYTAECCRLLRGSDVAGGELHVLEKFMPLEGRRW
jgi:hypothetical protein